MQSITKDYLLDIIQRKISNTIHLHRKRYPYSFNAVSVAATPAEVQEFVASIPYFDASLKAFLTAGFETQTIISQTWELEFIKKCEQWMQGYEWLYGTPIFLNEVYNSHPATKKTNLTLPY